MIAYLCKRLAWAFLVLLGSTGIVFVVVHLSGDPLFHELTGKVPELKLIGDAHSPRRIHDALLEGTRVARAI